LKTGQQLSKNGQKFIKALHTVQKPDNIEIWEIMLELCKINVTIEKPGSWAKAQDDG